MEPILSQYALDAELRLEPTVPQGLSGARLWRVHAGDQDLCLRRWPPEHPSPERLTQIHAVLQQVQRQAGPPIPVPLPTGSGHTFVPHEGYLWQLEPWLPGRADYHESPTPGRLRAAMQALAQFHCAAANLLTGLGRSPGIVQRLRSAEQLGGQSANYRRAVEQGLGSPLALIARQTLEMALAWQPSLLRLLAAAAEIRLPLQACIRDVWHEHVLLEGERVSGLVDFGGLGCETVAADVARLLGSLVGDDPEGWKLGLAAYEGLRPLSAAERQLVGTLDAANAALGGVLWIEWLFCQRRTFSSWELVRRRLCYFHQRLQALSLDTDR